MRKVYKFLEYENQMKEVESWELFQIEFFVKQIQRWRFDAGSLSGRVFGNYMVGLWRKQDRVEREVEVYCNYRSFN